MNKAHDDDLIAIMTFVVSNLTHGERPQTAKGTGESFFKIMHHVVVVAVVVHGCLRKHKKKAPPHLSCFLFFVQLVGKGYIGKPHQGVSVSLAANGIYLGVGGKFDNKGKYPFCYFIIIITIIITSYACGGSFQ